MLERIFFVLFKLLFSFYLKRGEGDSFHLLLRILKAHSSQAWVSLDLQPLGVLGPARCSHPLLRPRTCISGKLDWKHSSSPIHRAGN